MGVLVGVFNIRNMLAACMLLLVPFVAGAGDSVGEVVYVKGDVQIGSAAQWQAGTVGMKLFEGQHVRTGVSSRIRLGFSDGTQMQMGQNAEAVIEHYQVAEDQSLMDAILELVQGRARFIVQKLKRADSQYKVRMRAVLIGVRGTDILAQAESGSGHVALVEGRVALTQRGGSSEVMLARGGYVNVSQQWPVNPVEIPQQWLDAFIQDVGLSNEGARKKKGSGSDDAPPASVIQQKSINQLGSPTIVPR